MPPVDHPFPLPPPSQTSSSLQSTPRISEMHKDHILNMSPRPSHHLNHIVQLRKTSLDRTSNVEDSEKEQGSGANASPLSDGRIASKSSAELVNEIATLEVEILHLERYLLSLYRTTFQQQRIVENNVQQLIGGTSEGATTNKPSPKIKLGMSKEYCVRQFENSPTSSLAGPNDSDQVAIPKSSSRRERLRAYSRHRSLADHLGNSCMDDARICPYRLSEDIIRCISAIYCRLANPDFMEKGCSGSSTSSFCSSSTFSPRNLSGSWSPQCNDEATQNCNFESLKQEIGPYVTTVEVLKICLDVETYSYAAAMLQKFRSVVKSLEIVDPMKMRREEKLAFWINIHNALIMHAYLAYGTQYMKSSSIVKASYKIGGHCINAYDIQSSILGIRSHFSAPWIQTLLSPGKKLKPGNTKHAFAIEYPEPLVHFALSSGAYSDPAVRVYRANNIFEDLKVAKEEFIQSTVYVHRETKIYLPKILCYYAKDMSIGMTALLEVVTGCVSGIQKKSIKKCMKGRPEKYIYWLEQSASFRYLIHGEMAEKR